MTPDGTELIEAAESVALAWGCAARIPSARLDRLYSAAIAYRVASRFDRREKTGWLAAQATQHGSVESAATMQKTCRRRRHPRPPWGHGQESP